MVPFNDHLVALLDRVLDAALLVDGDERVIFANPDTERVFARERDEILGRPLRELIPDLPSEWRTPGLQVVTALRGQSPPLEVRLAATPVGEICAITLQDRAASGPAPSMPATAEDGNQMLSDIAGAIDAFLFAGEMTESGWYLTLFHGPGIGKLLGAEVEHEDANRAYDRCVHPEDYPAYERLYDLARREDGIPMEVTYRLRGLDGVTRWVRERSVPRRVDGRTLLFGVATDVTREVASEALLTRAQTERLAAVARFERVVELANDLILALDEAGEIRFANPAFETLLGYPPASLHGASWSTFVHTDDLQTMIELNLVSFGGPTGAPTVVRCRPREGAELHVSWSGAFDKEDGLMFYVGHDVTAEVAARAELERRARTDSLTELYNRRHVVDMLQNELGRSSRDGRVPGVIIVDLDHFKRINDRYRHEAGDAVLRTVAQRLKTAVRSYDVVGRWGGEEFIVVVPGVANEASLRRVGEAIRRVLSATPVVLPDGTPVDVTASVGCALAREDLWSVEALVDAADRALFAAKRGGRDQVLLAGDGESADANEAESEALLLAQTLAHAIDGHGSNEVHAREVASLSAAIAADLRLAHDRVHRCRLAGWVHDLGQATIPDAVLGKPENALDDAERAVLESHSVLGEQMVRRLPGFGGVARIVRHHHERLDGTGYPDGLSGDAIPLEARIVATADAFSALTCDRRGRTAVAEADALQRLDAEAGRNHDPRCVAALRRVLGAAHEATQAAR